MLRLLILLIIFLHGLVHLLYMGHSMQKFELRPGLTWPVESWFFSLFLSEKTTRKVVSITCLISALVFVVSGLLFTLDNHLGPFFLGGSAAFSSLLYMVTWNGKLKRLDEQGAVAIAINAALIIVSQYTDWLLLL